MPAGPPSPEPPQPAIGATTKARANSAVPARRMVDRQFIPNRIVPGAADLYSPEKAADENRTRIISLEG